jgi:hypothetical protein
MGALVGATVGEKRLEVGSLLDSVGDIRDDTEFGDG